MIKRLPRKTQNFTCIPNSLLEDIRLEFADRGLLCYLLSKPDNWEISVAHLVSQSSAGRDAIYGMLKRIRLSGYASYQKHSNGKTDWLISECCAEIEEKPNTDKPDLGADPHPDKPDLDNPDVLVSTEKRVSTERLPPIVPLQVESAPENPTTMPPAVDPVAWKDLNEYRSTHKLKRIRDSWTPLAKRKAATLLSSLDPAQQRTCVDITIANGYQGIFPEKLKTTRVNHETYNERYHRELNDAARACAAGGGADAPELYPWDLEDADEQLRLGVYEAVPGAKLSTTAVG